MIGERLLDLRREEGLTQDDLAAILNINKHSISSYERDKSEPPDEIKIAIAKYFGVSVDYLLGITNDPAPSFDSCSTLRLPPKFPREKLQSLYEYAEFLIYKQK